MKIVLFVLSLLLSSLALSAEKCKKDEATCRNDGYKAMQIVYFDLVIADCSSLGAPQKEEALRVRKEAMEATFGSPKWDTIVTKMKGIEKQCPDLTKSLSFSK